MRWVPHDGSKRRPLGRAEVAEGAFSRGSMTDAWPERDDVRGPVACSRLEGPPFSAREERCCQDMCTCNKAAEVGRLKDEAAWPPLGFYNCSRTAGEGHLAVLLWLRHNGNEFDTQIVWMHLFRATFVCNAG